MSVYHGYCLPESKTYSMSGLYSKGWNCRWSREEGFRLGSFRAIYIYSKDGTEVEVEVETATELNELLRSYEIREDDSLMMQLAEIYWKYVE